jgi:hypothetical protein
MPRERGSAQSGPKIKVKIPTDLELGSNLPASIRGYSDYIRWFLGRLKDGRVHRLNGTLLRDLFPRNKWTIAKRWLIETRIIDHPLPYSIGSHCYGYRLARKYRDQVKVTVVIKDKVLEKKLRKRWAKLAGGYFNEHQHLYDHMRAMLSRVTLDGVSVSATFVVGRRGRVFTSLTGMPRNQRHLLRADGEELVQIDVKNCFPTLIAYLAKLPRIQLQETVGKLLHDKNYLLIENQEEQASHRTGIYAVELGGSHEPDLLAVCQSGLFYEVLLSEAGEIDRASLKKEFQVAVVSGREYPCAASRAFRSLFPEAARMVRTLKRNDHRRLARALQRFESSLMIGRVARDLMEGNPNLWFSTVHDALLVKSGDVSEVIEAIKRAFGLLGIEPGLDVKSLSPGSSAP